MIPEDRADQAGELSAEDLAILDEIPSPGSTSSVAKDEAGAESATGAKAGNVQGSASADDNEEEVEDLEEPIDPSEEKVDEEDPDNPDGENTDPDNKEPSQQAEVDDDDFQMPEPEVVKQATEQFVQARETYLAKLTDHYKPIVENVRSTYDAALSELKEIDKKYEKDEDGWAPPVDYKDVLRRQELASVVSQNEAHLQELANEIPQAQAKIETELYVKTNVTAYPGLAKYEIGFRELVGRGVKFDTVEQAITLSKAMQQSMGKEPLAKGKAPTRQQIIQKVEEDKLKQREAMKIGAGRKGSQGGAATKPKPDTYKQLSSKARNDMRYFDTLMEV